MRIALLSDLHLEFEENRRLWPEILAKLRAEGPEIVIAGGDIDENDDRLLGTLSDLVRTGAPVLFLPGNHELKVENDRRLGATSEERYARGLHRLCHKAGAIYLPVQAPVVREGVAFLGVPGWCDGTLASKPFGEDEVVKGDQWTPRIPDAWISRRFRRELQAQLRELEATRRFESVRAVVAIFHFVPSRRLIEPIERARGEKIDRETAGGSLLSTLTSALDDLVLVVHGHKHIPYAARINDTLVVARPFGRPDQVGTDRLFSGSRTPPADRTAALARRAYGIIHLDVESRQARLVSSLPPAM
jgi:predicted phosphodiesterase